MNEEDEAFEDLAKRQGDWGMQGSRKHQIMRYAENNESKGNMTQDEIIEMAKQAGIEEAYSLKHNQYLVKFKDGSLEAFAKLVAERALADPMREVQRLGQEIEQEPVMWPCLIDSADFSANTITLVMQCEGYKVSAGTHWLSTTPPKD